MNHEAIYKLNPSVITIRGDVAYDANENIVEYDKAAVQAYVDAHAYITKRAAEYPSIQEQLDMQYWDKINGTNTWEEAIQAIKQKYPKPE